MKAPAQLLGDLQARRKLCDVAVENPSAIG